MEETANGGILIYPAYFKATIEKNRNYFLTINIKNSEKTDISVSTSVAAFNQDTSSHQNSLELTDKFEDWFELTNSVVPAGKTESLKLKLHIPQDEKLSEASYYPAIIVATSSDETSGTAKISIEQVIPIYLEIYDQKEVSAKVDKFSISPVVLGEKTNIDMTIKNSGNTFFSPISYVEFFQVNILNPEEKTRIESHPVSTGTITLLPESYIDNSMEWERSKIGKYEATLYVMNGGSEIESATKTFWIIPKEYITYLLVTIFLLTFGIYILRRLRAKAKNKS